MGLNVLAITPAYAPWSLVGSWLSTHQCLRRLVERGHQVAVRTSVPHPYNLDGVAVANRIEPGEPVEADVVVWHHGDAHAARVLDGAVVPLVRMVHGPSDRLAVGPHEVVVWNSEASRQGRPGIVVRPHVDPTTVRTTPGDMVTLVNLSREKGVDQFRRIARRMPDRQFLGVVGGWGVQRDEPRSNITIQRCTRNMRGDVYRRTRVLLMPSKAETWGRVGVEAMCSGIPVIAHPTPGLRESLGDAGIFVDRRDIAGWVDAIRSLDDPDVYAARSERCRERAESLDTAADLDLFADAVEALA